MTETATAAISQMSAALARNWGWVLLRGLLGIVIGVIALSSPAAALGALVLLFAIYSAADGIVAIISAVKAARKDERWVWFLVEGVIDLGAAAVALFMPLIAIKVFVFVIAFWAIFSGAAMLVAALKLQIDHGRWWLIIGGALSVLWGVLLLFQPAIGALILTLWFGVYALTFGIILVILAFNLRGRHEKAKAA